MIKSFLLLLTLIFQDAVAFSTSKQQRAFVPMQQRPTTPRILLAFALTPEQQQPPDAAPSPEETPQEEKAATGTVNQRLLVELEEAAQREKYGASSRLTTTIFGSPVKTDAERRQAIAEAQNLNGVNPVTALLGSLVAFAGAAGFWTLTQFLADTFAAAPNNNSDTVYVVARLTTVLRNVVVGVSALGAGFFGVTGVGIFALGVRVGYGVWVTKELDPTPRQTNTTTTDVVDMGAMWALMTNQNTKRGQR